MGLDHLNAYKKLSILVSFHTMDLSLREVLLQQVLFYDVRRCCAVVDLQCFIMPPMPIPA